MQKPSLTNAIIDNIRTALNQQPAIQRLVVAYSGGIDSTVLLDAILKQPLSLPVSAIYINHQLQADADKWAQHCETFCQQRNVDFEIIKVDTRPYRQLGPEAAARKARYQAFAEQMQVGDCLLTAQHQDDQAETLLLQMFRGAGSAGLSAMPMLHESGGGWHLRPMLNIQKTDIIEYAKERKLVWVDDTSNQNTDYDRNYLRHEVIPLIKQRWSSINTVLARVANIQADTNDLLNAIAGEDLEKVKGQFSGTLSVSKLQAFNKSRQANLLRHVIKQHQWLMPSEAVLNQVLDNMLTAKWDSEALIQWNKHTIRRYRDDIFFMQDLPRVCREHYVWPLHETLVIQELGIKLTIADLHKVGLSVTRSDILTVKFRKNGERIQLPGRDHTHSVKKILQERQIPPWLRWYLPFLYQDKKLIAILGLDPPIISL